MMGATDVDVTVRSVMNDNTAGKIWTREDYILLAICTPVSLGFAGWIIGLLLTFFFGFELNQPPFIIFMTGSGFMALSLLGMIVGLIVAAVRRRASR